MQDGGGRPDPWSACRRMCRRDQGGRGLARFLVSVITRGAAGFPICPASRCSAAALRDAWKVWYLSHEIAYHQMGADFQLASNTANSLLNTVAQQRSVLISDCACSSCGCRPQRRRQGIWAPKEISRWPWRLGGGCLCPNIVIGL